MIWLFAESSSEHTPSISRVTFFHDDKKPREKITLLILHNFLLSSLIENCPWLTHTYIIKSISIKSWHYGRFYRCRLSHIICYTDWRFTSILMTFNLRKNKNENVAWYTKEAANNLSSAHENFDKWGLHKARRSKQREESKAMKKRRREFIFLMNSVLKASVSHILSDIKTSPKWSSRLRTWRAIQTQNCTTSSTSRSSKLKSRQKFHRDFFWSLKLHLFILIHCLPIDHQCSKCKQTKKLLIFPWKCF